MGAAALARAVHVEVLILEDVDADGALSGTPEEAEADEEAAVVNADLGDASFDAGLGLGLREQGRHGHRAAVEPASDLLAPAQQRVVAQSGAQVLRVDGMHGLFLHGREVLNPRDRPKARWGRGDLRRRTAPGSARGRPERGDREGRANPISLPALRAGAV